ncbi:DUF4426 domain-containing protein [Arenimonas donghaensis]|uniref:DUF4426 domain-containing protein n=1 Tax=Arenimonas donghaensis DSM 18148 = HO3-R19 TaxID=1121014 RepID=A0A087MJG4_9GAMM|nr:DUF4426 domain-containing protein [Arenimonas donghaensis]KFL37017.1 hypothetical protein N788_11800 [Arenimonas donghaensis DSM 18148 = HO3-R19]
MRLIPWLTAALLVTLAHPAGAGSMRVGELRVYFNALPSTTLTPDVARQYGITRSANRALLNVSVRRGEPGADVAVPATVDAVATNLAGQRMDVRMREVRDGDALYYLGQARINAQDTLRFDLTVTVEGQAPMKATFEQAFFPQ